MKVVDAKVMRKPDNPKQSRGFGFVEMEDGSEAAIEALNGVDFKGRALRVNEAQSKQRPGGGGGGGRRF